MKKKLLIALLVVSMLVCVLAACGKKCDHNWEETATTATCEASGEATMTCSLCGQTTKTTVAALGHNMEYKETVKANCKTGGYDLYECTRENCDKTENRNETKQDFVSGHDYQPVEFAPTCDKTGYTDNICVLCESGDGSRVTIPKLGHTFEREGFDGVDGVVVTDAKCLENGEIKYNCTADGCGYSKVVTYDELIEKGELELAESLAATGHDFTKLVDYADPTCTVAGYMINACKNGCGEQEKKVTDPALGHSYQRADSTESSYEYKVTLAPTCITIGYEWVVCTEEECGFCTAEEPDIDEDYINTYRRDIAATGVHVFDKNPTVTAPLCEAQGYTTYGCSADGSCQETQDRDFVKELGHEMVLTTSKLENGTTPYCLTNGDYPYNCIRCDYTEVNHNGEQNNGAKHEGYTIGNYYAIATCISRATYYCTGCETVFESYVDENDPDANPTGVHKYTIEGDTILPTCSEYGYTVYCCSDDAGCDAEQRRDYVARTGHDLTAPTENGTIECTVCSAKFIDQSTVIFEENKSLCTHGEGETCDACGIGVVITGTKTPDAPKDLEAGKETVIILESVKISRNESGEFVSEDIVTGAALIELNGDVGTTYTIVVYDRSGAVISSYDVVDDETGDTGKIDVVTTASGSCVVDITEIEAEVGSVAITASTAATVSFYVTLAE